MKRWLLIAVAAFATAGFLALGAWQVERRAWKLALIERVEQRVHATPVAAPGPPDWPGLDRQRAEYRRVTVTGRLLEDRQTLVRAVTELGEGFWLMAPIRTDEGFVVLVNRGFVPQGWRESARAVTSEWHAAGDSKAATDSGTAGGSEASTDSGIAGDSSAARDSGAASASRAAIEPRLAAGPVAIDGTVRVTGLLRMSEPNGAFLRSNAPAENRWYSRDVEAISRAQHLTATAPYFVDAEADAGNAPDTKRPPIAGLTVVHFRNSHLQYALTWFTLALMALVLGVRVTRNR
ncbi:MAG: SURF1 family protein [Gammaproteobacteria bacterium]